MKQVLFLCALIASSLGKILYTKKAELFVPTNSLIICNYICILGAAINDVDIDVTAIDNNEELIVGGSAISIQQAPHMANLQHLRTPICGAAIISARHCLTAAHCLEEGTEDSQYSVIVGDTNISGRDRNAFATLVNRFIQHGQYDAQSKRNDIAVLLLERTLPLNGRTIAAIRMPNQNARVPVGQTGTVTGWYVTL